MSQSQGSNESNQCTLNFSFSSSNDSGMDHNLQLVKVTVHLQTVHLVEILNFRLMYRSKHELSSKRKFSKILKSGREMAVLSFGQKYKLPI